MKTVVHRATGLGAAALGLAMLTSQAGAQPAPARNPPTVYDESHPSFSDMMTSAVQPRHTKLGLALRAGNWDYMTYEAGELRGSFTRIVRSIPSYEGKNTAMLLSMITPQLDAMQAAVKARNAKAATAAYADLTATCNQCHVQQNRNYIVIRVPTVGMYSDQDFSPH